MIIKFHIYSASNKYLGMVTRFWSANVLPSKDDKFLKGEFFLGTTLDHSNTNLAEMSFIVTSNVNWGLDVQGKLSASLILQEYD